MLGKSSLRGLTITIAVLLAAGLLGACRAAPKKPVAAPRSEVIEQRFGIRVTQIGVTADNGLLDFRYIVLDSEKALNMLENEQTVPILVDEFTGTAVRSQVPMAHRHDLRLGETYFILFYNPQGTVKPGSLVGVHIGDLILDHVMTQ